MDSTNDDNQSGRAFNIRQGSATDIPSLARQRAAMFRDMGKLLPDLEDALVRATAAYLRDALPRGEYLAWVAQDANAPRTIVGGGGVQLRPLVPRPGRDHGLELGPEAIVLSVYVDRAWRRVGVGEALMRAILESLSARGIRRIVLHASEEGRRLYERLGFVATNEMLRIPR